MSKVKNEQFEFGKTMWWLSVWTEYGVCQCGVACALIWRQRIFVEQMYIFENLESGYFLSTPEQFYNGCDP